MLLPQGKLHRASGCSCTPAYDTSDRSGSIAVTSNISFAGPGPLSNLVDSGKAQNDTDSVYWTGGQTSAGLYLQFDWGSGNSFKMDEFTFYQSTAVSHGIFRLRTGDNAADWTNVGGVFTLGNGLLTQIVTEPNGNPLAGRYWQIFGVSPNTNGTPWLHEFEFKGCLC